MFDISSLKIALAEPMREMGENGIPESLRRFALIWDSDDCKRYIDGLGKLSGMLPLTNTTRELITTSYGVLLSSGHYLRAQERLARVNTRHTSIETLLRISQINNYVTIIKSSEPLIDVAFKRRV